MLSLRSSGENTGNGLRVRLHPFWCAEIFLRGQHGNIASRFTESSLYCACCNISIKSCANLLSEGGVWLHGAAVENPLAAPPLEKTSEQNAQRVFLRPAVILSFPATGRDGILNSCCDSRCSRWSQGHCGAPHVPLIWPAPFRDLWAFSLTEEYSQNPSCFTLIRHLPVGAVAKLQTCVAETL